jgi:DNA-binding CsgD family transcriptional regulator
MQVHARSSWNVLPRFCGEMKAEQNDDFHKIVMELNENDAPNIQKEFISGVAYSNTQVLFSQSTLISNLSLPSIITDGNLICYQSAAIDVIFKDILFVSEGKVVFRNRRVRERFFNFSKKVRDTNPIIYSMSEMFSLFDDGAFQKIVSFRSLIDLFNRQKILISVLNLDFKRTISPAVLQDLFGFTPSESQLALLLMNGKSVVECADETGVRISTVREKLSNLFAKTRTSRQPELVSMLTRLDLLV